MYKVLLILAVLLVGCDTNPKDCIESGYKGMVIPKDITWDNSCSNGGVSPNGLHFVTRDGNANISHFYYLSFQPEVEKERK